jgi:hypothetical protein
LKHRNYAISKSIVFKALLYRQCGLRGKINNQMEVTELSKDIFNLHLLLCGLWVFLGRINSLTGFLLHGLRCRVSWPFRPGHLELPAGNIFSHTLSQL